MYDWLDKNKGRVRHTYKEGVHTLMVTDYEQTYYVIKDLCDRYYLTGVYHYLTKYFDPTQTYVVTLRDETAEIVVDKTESVYKLNQLFNYLNDEGLIGHGIEDFNWLVQNTRLRVTNKGQTVFEGTDEFNRVLRLHSVKEVMSLIDTIPYLTMKGINLHAVLTDEVRRDLIKRGWYIKGEFRPVSLNHYILPFDLELEEDELLNWLNETRLTMGRYLDYDYTDEDVYVNIKGKNDYIWFLNKVGKDLGNSRPLMDAIQHFTIQGESEFRHSKRVVHVVHEWAVNNIDYMRSVDRLIKRVDFTVATGKKIYAAMFYQVLKDSQYDRESQSLVLADYLYSDLGILQDSVVGDYIEVGVDIYAQTESDYGELEYITQDIQGVCVATPYKRIHDGKLTQPHKYVLLPRYRLPKVDEAYINSYIMRETRPYNQERYEREQLQLHSLEAIQSQYNITGKEELDINVFMDDIPWDQLNYKKPRYLNLKDRLLNIPYISEVKIDGRDTVVDYTSGKPVSIRRYDDMRDEDILIQAIYQTSNIIDNKQEIDIAMLVLSVFEQINWTPVFKYDDDEYNKVWEDHLLDLVGKATTYYYTGLGYTDVLNLMTYYPKTSESQADMDTINKELESLGFVFNEDKQDNLEKGTEDNDTDKSDDGIDDDTDTNTDFEVDTKAGNVDLSNILGL